VNQVDPWYFFPRSQYKFVKNKRTWETNNCKYNEDPGLLPKPKFQDHAYYIPLMIPPLSHMNVDHIFIMWRIDSPLGNGSTNTFPRRQILGKEPLLGYVYKNTRHLVLGIVPINTRLLTLWDKNERCFLCGPRRDCLLDNCVVTRLYNKGGAVFSVLRGPCRGNIRESNSEASSCRSTEEYKEYDRENENKNWRSTTEFSVGDGHRKLVVEEELEVSLWRLSVWLQDSILISLPGYD
jgi:hypothetical protein